jgi:hypothetical protein
MPATEGYASAMALVFLALCLLFVIDRVVLMNTGRGGAPLRLPFSLGTDTAVKITLFVTAWVVFYLLNNHEFVFYNNYSYLAESLLQGRLDVTLPAYLESVEFAGRQYMHFAPGPALLLMPFVAAFGVDGFNTAYLCVSLGALNAVLWYQVFTNLKIGADARDRVWCTMLAVFGTVHCFLAAVGHSWFLGHVSSWFFILCSMAVLTGGGEKRAWPRAFVSGLLFGLAVTCRLSNLPGGLFLAGYLIIGRGHKIKRLTALIAGAAIIGALYMYYNYARFGTVMDIGYGLTYLKDKYRDVYDQLQALPPGEQPAFFRAAEKELGGALQAGNIPYNLYSIFLMMPRFVREYPYIIPTQAGVSLTCLSPALFFCVRAGWKKPIAWVLAGATLACAIPFALNYGNGMSQFGMRYAMDFLPYLIILASMGLTRQKEGQTGRMGSLKAAAILFCVLMNVWGPIYWNCFYLAH